MSLQKKNIITNLVHVLPKRRACDPPKNATGVLTSHGTIADLPVPSQSPLWMPAVSKGALNEKLTEHRRPARAELGRIVR
jgi:hypothetical protein